jgi:hypothetical protein
MSYLKLVLNSVPEPGILSLTATKMYNSCFESVPDDIILYVYANFSKEH